MKEINIDYVGLESTFSKETNIITTALKKLYKVNITSSNPDYIFYGDGTREHLDYDCIKICICQENRIPNFRQCDYGISCLEYNHPRYLRIPFYVHFYYNNGQGFECFVKSEDEAERVLAEKNKFCSFVYSNANPKRTQRRIDFFHKLSKYKKVDSGGQAFNNIGYRVEDKIGFLRPYKFNICFENRTYPGYVTEKPVHCFESRCMPIHWGSPDIYKDFNTRSFVNTHDFDSDDEVIDYIIELDKNDDLYLEKLKEPYFYGNKPSHWFDENAIIPFLRKVFESPRPKRNPLFCRDLFFNAEHILEPYLGGHLKTQSAFK